MHSSRSFSILKSRDSSSPMRMMAPRAANCDLTLDTTPMHRILITWELGSGWGHVVPLVPIIELLRARGNEVVLAMHDMARAVLLEAHGVVCVKCPSLVSPLPNQFPYTSDYAQVLFNVGFGDAEALSDL